LLARRKNSRASNYAFVDKKQRYFATDAGTSPFALTSQVLRGSEWKPEVLERREIELLVKLAELWNLEKIP
jgi:hypothetical protein